MIKIFKRKRWLIIAFIIICGLSIAIIVSSNSKSNSQFLSIEQALILGANNLNCNVSLDGHLDEHFNIKGDVADCQKALHLLAYLSARKSLANYSLSGAAFLAPRGVSLKGSIYDFSLKDDSNRSLYFRFYFGITGYGVFEINDDISCLCDKYATDKIIEFLICFYQKYNMEMPLYLSNYLNYILHADELQRDKE